MPEAVANSHSRTIMLVKFQRMNSGCNVKTARYRAYVLCATHGSDTSCMGGSV